MAPTPGFRRRGVEYVPLDCQGAEQGNRRVVAGKIHFLDRGVLRPRNPNGNPFATDPRFAAWQKAIDGSDAIEKLRDLERTKTIDRNGRPYKLDQAFVRYLLKPEEIWARSYAQYVAARSTDAALKKELAGMVGVGRSYPLQWADEVFEPIALAIDSLFESLGWGRRGDPRPRPQRIDSADRRGAGSPSPARGEDRRARTRRPRRERRGFRPGRRRTDTGDPRPGIGEARR